MRKEFLVLVAMLISVKSIDAWTEEEQKSAVKYDLGEIIVTATRTEAYQAEVGSSTTVLTSEEIGKRCKMTVVELLRTVQGITVTQQGGLGNFSQVYLRGGEPGYTMVMIDGVEVKYPMEQFGGFFDFAHLTSDNIERIEIIRGPQSTLYGSSAISGVINIITKRGRGKPRFNISSEGGSNNTFREAVDLKGSTNKTDYSFSISRIDSDGISSVVEGTEKDGCEITNASGRLGFEMFDDSELSLVFRYTDAKMDLDTGGDDPNDIGEKRMLSSKLQLDQSLTDRWEHKIFFSFLDTKRSYEDPPDSVAATEDKDSWYEGDIKKVDWQNNFCPFDFYTITCGFDYKEERGSSYYRSGAWISKVDRKTVDNKGYYLQNQLKLREKIFTTVGIRLDDHELFGTESTYKVSSAYLTDTGTRLKASWGTGFRSPSIYQLYSSYGDPGLNPEESESYDFGFEQDLLEDKLSFGITYFHNDFKNSIDYNSSTRKYENIGKAETKGTETEITFRPMERLTINANYTHLNTRDKETGLELLRRPEHQANLNLDWQFLKKGNFNLGIIYVGRREDYVGYPTRGTNEAYTRVDVSTFYDLTENFQVFGRIENLFDEEYEEVHGFGSPGASFYAGVRTTF